MEANEIIRRVFANFQKERQELEESIRKLENSSTPGKKKKSFKKLVENERLEEQLLVLQSRLTNLADEVEEFQFRVGEILSKNPPDAGRLVEQEYEIMNKHLPVYRFRQKVLNCIRQNDVTILVADTGSGKSTLLTQFLHFHDQEAVIYCCQPRRLAASTLVDYTNTCLGLDSKSSSVVAYDFNQWDNNVISGTSKIVYTTNNGLLWRWRSDHELKNIDVVVIDETHERTLSTDLLLGIMKEIHSKGALRKRPIKTVIMSATIDPSIFHNYFKDSNVTAECIAIPGKTFPVECIYDELSLSSEPKEYVQRTVDKAWKILSEHDEGDILAFLATPLEIEEAYELINDDLGSLNRSVKVYALHSGVETEKRKALFSKKGFENEQRIILSTNIAETSVTLPGIVFVIDSGRQKEFTFDLVRNVGSLTLAPISKSSAVQRTGRAGRVCSGVCYRLYKKDDFDGFPPGQLPELLRLPLDQALLSLFNLGFTEPKSFDFIEPPPPEAISVGIASLLSLGAIRADEHDSDVYSLTDVGNKMTKLSLIPKLSHLIINTLSLKKDLILEILVICGVLSGGDGVFYRSKDFVTAKIKKLKFCDERSDFLTMINSFKMWYQVPKNLQKVWCIENMISSRTMGSVLKFIHRTANQIKKCFRVNILPEGGGVNSLVFHKGDTYYEDILELVYTSNKTSVAVFSGHPNSGYINCSNGETMVLHPSSSLNCLESQTLAYLCYDKIITTSRTFIFNASMFKRDWVDDCGVLLNERVKRQLVSKFEAISRLGQHTIRKYIFPKLKDLVRTFKNSAPCNGVSSFFEVDVNLNTGCLGYWCHSNNKKYAEVLVQNLLDEARKGVMDEKMELEMDSVLIKIGSGGQILDCVHSDSIISLQIFCTKEEMRPIHTFMADIKGHFNSQGIDYEFQSTKRGRIWRFSELDGGLMAKTIIDDNFPTLNSKWSNENKTWLIFYFKNGLHENCLDSIVYRLKPFEGAVASLQPTKKAGRHDIKVTTPTREMARRIYETERYRGHQCTLFIKDSITIPCRATESLRKAFQNRRNIHFNTFDGVTVVSFMEMRHNNNRYNNDGSTFDLLTGWILMIDNFPPSFKLDNHMEMISEIESEELVAIVQDFSGECLTFKIFGSSEHTIGRAQTRLKKYFDKLDKTTVLISFDARKGHAGVLPTLFKKYGTNLIKLAMRDGLQGIDVDAQRKTIQIFGEKDVIEKVEEEIKGVIELKCDRVADLFDPCVMCEGGSNEKYFRLQLCGHKVCHGGCIQMLVLLQKFPLTCAQKDCGKELTAVDMKTALGGGESAEIRFLSNAFKNVSSEFVKCKGNQCFYLFKIDQKAKRKYMACPCCGKRMCIACGGGYNCECFVTPISRPPSSDIGTMGAAAHRPPPITTMSVTPRPSWNPPPISRSSSSDIGTFGATRSVTPTPSNRPPPTRPPVKKESFCTIS